MIVRVLGHSLRGLATLGFWTLWLALSLGLALQLFILTHHELGVPGFLLRALEQRLAASGVRASFGTARFDPSGRILVEDARLIVAGAEEPVITARAIYARLDPLALLAGRFEPVEIRVTGLSARVPPALSPSGAADEIVRDVDGWLAPAGNRLEVRYLTGWVGDMAVAARGTLLLERGSGGGTGPLPVADFFASHYGAWSSQTAAALGALANLDRPVLRLDLLPGAPGSGLVLFSLSTDHARVPGKMPVEGRGVRVSGAWRLGAEPGAAARLTISAERLGGPGGVVVHGLLARADGISTSAAPGTPPVSLETVEFGARDAQADKLQVLAPWGRADVRALPRLAGTLGAWLNGEPCYVAVAGDAKDRSGAVTFDTRIGADGIAAWERALGLSLRPWVDWARPLAISGTARFASGGRFAAVSARVDAREVTARTVHIDEVRGELDFDGRTLVAPDAFARLGENYARGRFEDDPATNDYRFLLAGRLRPLDITPWIAGDWWAGLFGNFAFPRQPPAADIDLRGCWTDGRKAVIFLRVDAPGMAFRGLDLDALEGRMFIRPQFSDILAFSLRRGEGGASGAFSRSYSFAAGNWQAIDLHAESTLAAAPLAKVLDPDVAGTVAAFAFAKNPRIAVDAHFTSDAAPGGAHRKIRLETDSNGPLAFHGYPLDRARFAADVNDARIDVTGVEAAVAGGTLQGGARLDGEGAAQTLAFDAKLRDASLAQIITVINGASPPKAAGPEASPPSRFLQGKSTIRLNAAMSAQGKFGSAYTFDGSGSMELGGGQIGQIRMLGLLSDLLRFTSLRFTDAKAAFKLAGPSVDFTDVEITGANSAISARGTYALDSHALDIRARLNPFSQSHSIPQRFMDLVLTPISDALEVRLTGSVEKPRWAFVNGPTNFVRNLGPPTPAAANGVAPAR